MSSENNSQRRYYEKPLGTIAGFWEEPGPRFVDPYTAAERKAIREIEREAELEIKKRKKENANTTTK